MVSTTEANNSDMKMVDYTTPTDYAKKSIQFTEAGILFRVHPNGQVSYAIEQKIRKQYVNKNSKRYVLRQATPTFRLLQSRASKVRVGQVMIYFNRQGKVQKIGTVAIRYHRGKIARVGELHVSYNSRGQVQLIGKVNPISRRSYS